MSKPSRRWMFTYNNPPTEEIERLRLDSTWERAGAKFVCFQPERGDGTGTLHLQGFLVWKNPKRLAGCRRVVQCHWEIARGNDQQCLDYVSKEDTRAGDGYQFGDRSHLGQGRRTDILAAKEDLDSGMTEKQVADRNFGSWCKYHRAFSRYRNLSQPQRNWTMQISILVGRSGCGKSRWAIAQDSAAYWMMRPNGASVFFDGYDAHETIVLDDFYGWMPYDFLIRLIDSTPLWLQVKGGATPMLAKHIIITSNRKWEEWYPNQYQLDGCSALERRFNDWATFIDEDILANTNPSDFNTDLL